MISGTIFGIRPGSARSFAYSSGNQLSFSPRLRYSGTSIGYQSASIIAGGPAPIIATALFATYQSGYAIAVFIAGCAVISAVAAAFMPDYTGQDISAEYDA